MGSLANPVKTETYILLIAGLVMVITLWTSKKAHRVVKTSVDLSRQGEGDERFGSSFFARSLVRGSDRKSTRLNSSHVRTSYAVFCWKKKSTTPTGGGMGGDAATSSELTALLSATGSNWSAAVSTSQTAASLELASGTSLLSLGGWSG